MSTRATVSPFANATAVGVAACGLLGIELLLILPH
jgi:hypothetical protein